MSMLLDITNLSKGGDHWSCQVTEEELAGPHNEVNHVFLDLLTNVLN